MSTPLFPGRVPMLGHAPRMMREGLAFMEQLREYGPVVKIYLGRSPRYVINDPELLRRILVTDAGSFEGRGALAERASVVLGNGISCSTGPFHRRQRRLIQPAFHRERVASYIEIMRQATQDMTGSWSTGESVLLEHEIRELALTIVTKALFSADMGKETVEEFRRSMPIALAGVASRTMMPWLAKLPTPANRRFDAALARLRRGIDEMITEYRRAGVDHGDVLSLLLAAREEESGAGMSDEQLHAEVMTLVSAGTETANVALLWAMHELGQRPEFADRICEESRELLGDRPLTFEDLPQLEFTGRFAKEVLRLHALWMLTRRSTAASELAGEQIPVGTEIIFSPQALHRDPRYFAEPTRFDPDRWLPERAAEIARGAYLPFGTGKYVCIGESFAWAEMLTVISTVAAQWRLRPPADHQVKVSTAKGGAPESLPMVPERRAE